MSTLLGLLIDENFSEAVSLVEQFSPEDRKVLLQTNNYGAEIANKLLTGDDPAYGIDWLNKDTEAGVNKLRTILDVSDSKLAKSVVETLFDGVAPEVIIKTLSDQRLLPAKEGAGWPISISEFVRLYQFVFREYTAHKMPVEVLERVFFPDGVLSTDSDLRAYKAPNASMFVLVTFGDGSTPSELDFARGFKRFLTTKDLWIQQMLMYVYPALRKRMELVGYSNS